MERQIIKRINLFAHQSKAIRESATFPYRLIFRLPGTGKTFIGVEILKKIIFENNSTYCLWIGPANLLKQYKDVFDDVGLFSYYFNSSKKEFLRNACAIVSYETFRLNIETFLDFSWDCIICDEAHRAKSTQTQINQALKKIRVKTNRFYAFSGTPFQNSPYEFFQLISLIAGKNLTNCLEQTLQYMRPKKNFIRNFLFFLGFKMNRLNQGPIIGVKEPGKLFKLVNKYVDYIPPSQYLEECRIPLIKEHFEMVQIDDFELSAYKKVLSSFRKKKDKDFFKDGLPDENLESVFNRLSDLRQILLDPPNGGSSKILRCVQDIESILKQEGKKVLVFCNFVERGLLRLTPLLKSKKLNFGFISGKTGVSERRKLISSYMGGDIPVLLLSPVGFEGLDLYGTTHILVLDPHFNPERTLQLVSRAIRAYSEVPIINITHYVAFSDKLATTTIDESILKIAERKKKLKEIIEECLINEGAVIGEE